MTAAAPNLGPFESEQDALDGLVGRLVATLAPSSIWLFGSRATGTARSDSDFDLLIVAPPGGRFGADDYEAVDRPVRDLRIGCDLVPCTHEDFIDGMALPTSMVAQVVRQGRKLYDAGAALP